jgi:poly-gamma-glutamate synthesis protein (capsule biosynthesis protein)
MASSARKTAKDAAASGTLTLFLCGDVMTGRGIDQILPHPGDPALREEWIKDARDYVALAEQAGGTVPRPADFAWPWGTAAQVLERFAPAVRLINLETAITRGSRFAPGKAVHYRMSPENLPCLLAAHPDVVVLANNHVLDFGREGLADTLAVLSGAGVATTGAGLDRDRARSPAIVAPSSGGGRVLVFAVGSPSAGVPREWAAGEDAPGVEVIAGMTADDAARLTERIRAVRRPGDIAVVSVHWGSNWGYAVPPEQTQFAHCLVDGGVDIVHGHSSHHPRPVEIYRGRLILYGCGDLINDYEGILGYEEFRPDLRALYFPRVCAATGELEELSVAVMRARKLRLEPAAGEDTAWLADVLNRRSRGFGTRVTTDPAETTMLHLSRVAEP